MYIYAGDLVERVRKVWQAARLYVDDEIPPALPADPVLRRLLDVTYHASLLTEEGRRPRFRVVYCPQAEFDAAGGRVRACTKIPFDRPVPFNEKQLLRLAPATDPVSVLIAVEPAGTDGELNIWGLISTGSSWWSHVRRESERIIHSPPDLLTIASTKPGQIAILRAWRILLHLENGQVVSPPVDVFLDGPIADAFAEPIAQLYTEVYAGRPPIDEYEPLLDRHNCTVKYITSIKRLLTYFMDKTHGGILVILPEGSARLAKIDDLLLAKYSCPNYSMWPTLVDCLKQRRLWCDTAAKIVDGNQACDKAHVIELTRYRAAVEELEHRLTDSIQLVAALSGVDGAVILTDRLRVWGFGAELKGSADIRLVHKALDAKCEQRGPIAPEIFGTRHRAAFRFCADWCGATAFVHSQDGGLKAVKKVGEGVVYWDVNPLNV